MTYTRIFEESWNRLIDDYRSGRFRPVNEYEVQCYLYHLCLLRLKEPRRIEVERGTNGMKVDLILGRQLFVELKFTRTGTRKRRGPAKKWIKDVNKLSGLAAGTPPMFALFVEHPKGQGTNPVKADDVTPEFKNAVSQLRATAEAKGVRVLLSFEEV